MVNPARVRIIKVGTICFESTEIASALNLKIKTDIGIGGGSTVVLIDGERKILLDTGFDFEWLDTTTNNERNAKKLISELNDLGMTPDDIEALFVTHWHRDHYGNLGVFRKAQYMASKSLVNRFELEDFIGLDDQDEIADGVKVMLTPGHTVEHASIIVDSMAGGIKARIAIAGDAVISHSYFQSGYIWQYNADFYNIEAARESMLRLASVSDVIIPGHGVPFMTHRP